MTDERSHVSVIVPCFNDGPTLRQAVDSVRGARNCEVVVVDDGSSDPDTLIELETLEATGISVIRQRNLGSSSARMAGLAASSGRYVVPLDADDRLLPGALERMSAYLDAREDIAAVWGDVRVVDDREVHVRHTAPSLDPWLVTYLNDQPGPGSMVRRSVLVETGGWFAPDLRRPNCYWDWNFWMALAERGYQGAHVGSTTLAYRAIRGSGRVNESCRAHHAELYEALQMAHPKLFGERRANWGKSRLPLLARVGIAVIDVVPGIPRSLRGRAAAAACQAAYRRGGYSRPLTRMLRARLG